MVVRLLNGLKVLEIGESLAVAFAGKLLAELGADVIVVEPPGGSRLRRLPPYYQGVAGPDRSVLHNWLAANKRSITLNLEDNEGQTILRRLIGLADAVVKTGEAVGLKLQEANPKLTITTVSSFGEGPYSNYRANDLVIFAMSGFSFYLARPVEDPATTPPKLNPGHQVSLVGGLYAASATLWGVLASQRKGQGVEVEMSEWEVFTSLMYEHSAWLSDGTLTADRKRAPNVPITVVGGLVWCLPCVDGWVLISPREDHQFKQWGEVIAEREWASSPELATGMMRIQHFWNIHERSASWTKTRTRSEVFKAAQEKKVACFPVGRMNDLPELEQLRHRGFWAEIDHPVVRGLVYPGLPISLDNWEVTPSRPAPRAGEHTLGLCKDLGMSTAELQTLWQLGAI